MKLVDALGVLPFSTSFLACCPWSSCFTSQVVKLFLHVPELPNERCAEYVATFWSLKVSFLGTCFFFCVISQRTVKKTCCFLLVCWSNFYTLLFFQQCQSRGSKNVMVSCKAVNGPTLRIRWRLLSLYDNPPSGRNTSQIKRNYLCRSWAIPPSRTAVMTPHTSPVNLHFLQRDDREKHKIFRFIVITISSVFSVTVLQEKKVALKKSRSWKPIGEHNLNSLSGHIFFFCTEKMVPRWCHPGVIWNSNKVHAGTCPPIQRAEIHTTDVTRSKEMAANGREEWHFCAVRTIWMF